MPGNILTDASATYGAITVLATDKSDAEARVDADVATYAIANWADEVDEALIKVNEWFAGTTSAGISGNTTRLLGNLRVDEDLYMGTDGAETAAKFQFVGTDGLLTVANTDVDATTKYFRLGCFHRDSGEQHVGCIDAGSNSSDNWVYIGGGSNRSNAATKIEFYTASNNTTTTGTKRMAIDSTGHITCEGTTSAFIPHKMNTTQRDALTAVAGMMIYNTSTNKHQGYNGSSWNDFY